MTGDIVLVFSIVAVAAVLFFLTAGLSLFLSNTASAVLIAPVAIQAAAMGVSAYPFAMFVLIELDSGCAALVGVISSGNSFAASRKCGVLRRANVFGLPLINELDTT